MAKDVSIVFKASDSLSNSIREMRKNVDALGRDVTEYRKIQSQAFDKKTEVKLDITKAKQELKALEREVKQNVEGSEKHFKEKQKHLEELQEEYRRLTQVAKEAGKAEKQLQDEMSKTSNKNASRMSSEKTPSVMSRIANAGLGNMLGESVTQNLNYSVSAILGEDGGQAVGNVVGSAASGAAMGSIAGPIGTAVGAAVGGLSGAITTLTDKQQKDDELYRKEVKSLYDLVKQEEKAKLDNGLGYASRFEQNMISFDTLLKGTENADRFLKDVQQFSAKTPFEMENLLNTSKTLLSYNYKQDEIIPLMTKVGDAGSALGMNADDMNWVATSLGRMQSTNKTTLEYLNPLIERGIPAVRYLAESLGKTEGQIYDMVSKGLIPGAEAATTIADAMGREFEGNMEKQSQTYEGLLSSLNDTKAEIDRAMGEGYSEKRKEGMRKELEYLNGEMGEQMKEANRLIGEYQAELENQYQQSIIASMNLVSRTTEFKEAEAQGDGATMGRLLAEARAKAEMEYKNSEGYRLQQETDLLLVQNIQQDTAINSAYMDYGERMAEQFTKGYSGIINEMSRSGRFTPSEVRNVTMERGNFLQKSTYFNAKEDKEDNGSRKNKLGLSRYATGTKRISGNDIPVLVHEGERILTKLEADEVDRKESDTTPPIHIEVNNYSQTPYEITQEICKELIKAAEGYVRR